MSPSHSRLTVIGTVAVQVVPGLVYLAELLRLRQWLIDDALISVAYAKSLQAGVYAQTPHDLPIEGVSNPLWTVMLAGLRAAGLIDTGHQWWGVDDFVVVFRLIAVVCFLGIQAMLFFLLRQISPRWGALSAALVSTLLAISPAFVIWTASGLENPLYGLLISALAIGGVAVARKPSLVGAWTGVVFGLLAVMTAATRPDGALFAAVYPVVVFALVREISRRQFLLTALTYTAVAGGLIGAGLLWRYLSFGLLVPNTALAKAQRFSWQAAWGRLLEIPAAITVPMTVAVLLVGLIATVIRPRLTLFVAAWPVVLSVGVFVILTRDWMGEYRFATPICVSITVLLGVATALLLERGMEGSTNRTKATALALVWAVTASGLGAIGDSRLTTFASSPTVPACFVTNRYGRLFNWYADQLHLSDQSTLLLPDLGGTLLTSRLRILDFAGLTEPTIAQLRNANKLDAIDRYVLNELRPTFIHLHPKWDATLFSRPEFKRDYVQLGSPEDWVRRDAITVSSTELASIQSEGKALTQSVLDNRSADLRTGCGPFRIGQLPAER